MKKLIYTTALLATMVGGAGSLQSCDRVKEAADSVAVPVPFDIKMAYETTIPFATVPTTSLLRYPEITMDLDVDAKIKEKYPSLSVNNLKSAKITGLTIELESATLGGKLDAINNANIYIKTPTLPEVLVGSVANNTSTDTLTFTTTNAEVIDYVKSKQNSLVLYVQGRKIVLDQFKIKISPTFNISVGLN